MSNLNFKRLNVYVKNKHGFTLNLNSNKKNFEVYSNLHFKTLDIKTKLCKLLTGK